MYGEETTINKTMKGSNYETIDLDEGDQPADKIGYEYECEKNSVNKTEGKFSHD